MSYPLPQSWNTQDATSLIVALLLITLLYLAPGLALLRLLWPRHARLPLAAHLSLAAGVGVALPPLLLLLFQQLHIPWNTATTWGYVLLSLAGAFVSLHPDPQTPPRRRLCLACPWHTEPVDQGDQATIALLLLTLAALVVRLFVVRDLPTGLFGDSYHHTMMAQLLVDNQGIFHSWQPYTPLETFTYHPGFHANAAFVHWLTGHNVVSSVLLVGQVLNALSVPLAFLLVVSLGGSRWSGVWAAFITGFVSTIPAFYVNWGRYTQLTGHIVLVVAFVAWVHLAEEQSWLRPIVLAALATAAMMLTHYLVTVFAAAFVGSYILLLLLSRRSWRDAGVLALKALPALMLALILAVPWLLNVLDGYLLRNATAFVKGYIQQQHVVQYAMLPPTIPLYTKSYVLVGAVVGLCIAGWQRQWRTALPGLWCVLLVLCVEPQLVGMPGTGMIDALTALGALYLTLPPLAGGALATVQENLLALTRRSPIPVAVWHAFVWVLLLAGMVWGSGWQMRMIDGSTQLVTHADMSAMEWVRTHTPPDALFLVNSFPAYGGSVVAGTDAGWWLPLLTGRRSTLPPITYGSELGASNDYAYRVNTLAESLRGHPITDPAPVRIDLTTPDALHILRKTGVDYIYIGAHPSPGHNQADWIDPSLLRQNAAFRLVYNQNGVEIFVVVQDDE